jgi:hypothetical protein
MTDGERAPLLHCRMCGKVWGSLDEVVADEDLALAGYQARFDRPSDGLILVTHDRAGCGTTMGFAVSVLRPLYEGPQHCERMALSETCSRQCLDENRLEVCGAACDMAWVREVMQSIRRHAGQPAEGNAKGEG